MKIKDRIIELKRVKAKELSPHPSNWRTHPKEQQDAMRSALAEIGYADALKVRQHNGGYQIIDGHLRAETTPEMEVPVLVLDLDESETKKMLATFDPLASLAGTDEDILSGLIKDIDWEAEGLGEIVEPKENVGNTHTGYDPYKENLIRRIILVFSKNEYDLAIQALMSIRDKQGIGDYTSAVMWLLREQGYEIPDNQD